MAKKAIKKPRTWFVKKLVELGACSEAVRYAKKYRTFPAAWNTCNESKWLGWLLQRLDFRIEHADWCAFCFNEDPTRLSAQLRRRFSAERVSKALRKA